MTNLGEIRRNRRNAGKEVMQLRQGTLQNVAEAIGGDCGVLSHNDVWGPRDESVSVTMNIFRKARTFEMEYLSKETR